MLLLTLASLLVATPPVDTIVLHRYTATEASYDVNAYWLESEEGVVVIDALFLQADARLLAGMIRSTGKPLLGILLTHPHVDHFGGVPALREAFPGVRLFATAGTAAAIQATHDRGVAAGWLQAMMGEAGYGGPARVDSIIASGAELALGGMHFRVLDMGAAEAADNTIVHQRELDALFTGDLTVAHAPVYVGEGRPAELMEALARLRAQFPDSLTVYSGHYAAMPLGELVEANLAQLTAARDIVRRVQGAPGARAANGTLTAAARREALGALAALYRPLARYGLSAEIMAAMNLPGLMAEHRAAAP